MSCAGHEDVAETHACSHCGKLWCGACIIPLRTTHRASCPECGHLVVASAPALDGVGKLEDALGRVRSMEGLTTAAAFAIGFGLSRYIGILLFAYVAAVVGYYFHIVRYVGDGHAGMPGPSDAVDSWGETFLTALTGLLCVLVGVLPQLIYLIAYHDQPDSLAGRLALAVIGQLYMPAALLAATLTNRPLAVAWPPAWIAIISRSPIRYARFAALWVASVAVIIAVIAVTAPIVDGSMSLEMTRTAPLATWGIGAAVAAFIWNVVIFGQAVLVGLYLRENRHELGFE